MTAWNLSIIKKADGWGSNATHLTAHSQTVMLIAKNIVTNKQASNFLQNNGHTVAAGAWGFAFLASDPIQVSASVSLKDGPGAGVASKLNELFSSKLIQGLGGSSVTASVPTDAWTQQVVDKSAPLTMSFKTRIYLKKITQMTCNASYVDIIKFLSLVCSPSVKYELKTATIDKAIAVARNMSTVVDAAKKKAEAEDESARVPVIDTVIDVLNQTASNAEDKRDQMTFWIVTDNFGSVNTLEWFVKSFSVQPSSEFVVQMDRPMPIYVDIDISVETVSSPSSEVLSDWLLKVPGKS